MAKGVDFDLTARTINAAVDRGVDVTGAILCNDDAVLSPTAEYQDPDHRRGVAGGSGAQGHGGGRRGRRSWPIHQNAVERLRPGNDLRPRSEQTKVVSPVARALTGNRSAVVVRTPSGDVEDRTIPAGSLDLVGVQKKATVDVSRGAAEIMAEVQRVSPLVDVMERRAPTPGGMIANVRQSMADLSNHALADVRIQDLLAIDTAVPQEVRGGVAGEVALENAVALAAMVRTKESGMKAVAEAVTSHLRGLGATKVDVAVGGVEAEMAVLGALTTPGTDKPLVVLDLGGGSTDAAVIETNDDIDATHLAGAGDLVTKLIDAELGLDNLELAEEIKRCPLGKAESFFHVRLENGTVQFFETPLPPTAFARVVALGENGMNPIPTGTRWTGFARCAGRPRSGCSCERSAGAAQRRPGWGSSSDRLRGAARRLRAGLRDPRPDRRRRGPFGIVCGTGNVRGTEGPRNAVASGWSRPMRPPTWRRDPRGCPCLRAARRRSLPSWCSVARVVWWRNRCWPGSRKRACRRSSSDPHACRRMELARTAAGRSSLSVGVGIDADGRVSVQQDKLPAPAVGTGVRRPGGTDGRSHSRSQRARIVVGIPLRTERMS